MNDVAINVLQTSACHGRRGLEQVEDCDIQGMVKLQREQLHVRWINAKVERGHKVTRDI
jgi:hypothetical protein